MTTTTPGDQAEAQGDPTGAMPPVAEADLRRLRTAGRSWGSVPPARTADGQMDVDPDLGGRPTRAGRPGERYIRITRHKKAEFEKLAPGVLIATTRAGQPTGGWAGRARRVREFLLGAPLASHQMAGERLSKLRALPILSSDPLSSVAYGPEAILVVLVAAGTQALNVAIPIMIAIVALLGSLILGYRQVVRAYPNAGGSYAVAKDQLGPFAGLVAGSALFTDYVLTVAVSVASGVAAITSAAPETVPYAVPMSLGFIVLLILVNLRGTRESATVFAIPTYAFVIAILVMLLAVSARLLIGAAHTTKPHAGPPLEALSLLLVLRAYASGCSSLTGIESISNSVNIFKPPEWRNARKALTIMGLLLAVMFVGILIATHILGLAPQQNQTLISQLAHIAFGNSFGYFIVAATTTGVLLLAANSAFTGLPRLLFFMANDDYAPHQLRRFGDRLALSNGIIVVGVLAAILIVVFQSSVTRLIPLYTIGVFVAFTLAQTGMVRRWLRRREPGWRKGLAINGVGAAMSGSVFCITAVAKFSEGAWVVIIVIPTLVALFSAVHRHYTALSSRLAPEIPTNPGEVTPLCIVPVADLNDVTLQSLAFARKICDRVIAVHVSNDEAESARMQQKWAAWGSHVPLEIIESPYRSLLRPLLAYINGIDKQCTGDTLVVVLPELVATAWWHHILHNQTALRLKAALLFRPGTVVVSVPYHLQRNPRVRRGLRRRAVDEL